MKGSLLLPASAALGGVLLAFGIVALKNQVVRSMDGEHFYAQEIRVQTDFDFDFDFDELAELAELPAELEAELAQVRVEMEGVQGALEMARRELQAELDSRQDLTESQRKRIQAAVERLDSRLAEMRVKVEVVAPAVPTAPEAPGGN